MIKLLIATSNQGKVNELNDLLKGLDHRLNVLSFADYSDAPPKIEEPYETFYENAVEKAVKTADIFGVSTLADDSGLCVDALNGAPGVYSARFAELRRNTTIPKAERDRENIIELLKVVRDAPSKKCHYVAAVAVAFQIPDFVDLFGESQLKYVIPIEGMPPEQDRFYRLGNVVVGVVEGRCNGKIVGEPRGTNGFGYDPIVELDGFGRTAAELTAEEKNGVSHRHHATQRLLKLLLATKKIPGHNPGI